MTESKIEIGQAELQQSLNNLTKQLGDLSKLDVQKVALAFGEKLLQLCNTKGVVPFKTGHLASTGNVQPTAKGAELRYDADYSAYVEYGSSKWSGHAWVRPTIDSKGNEIVDTAKDEVDKQIREKV